jgi:hypothetical protein
MEESAEECSGNSHARLLASFMNRHPSLHKLPSGSIFSRRNPEMVEVEIVTVVASAVFLFDFDGNHE